MNEAMKKWKKGVVLTTDRYGLPGQIQCAECGGIISAETKFYIENYVEEYCCLNTRFFHFNCVQTAENRVMPEPELVEIKEEVADVLSRKAGAEDDVAQAERDLSELEREESDLRHRIGKLVEGQGVKDDRDRCLRASSLL